MIMLFLGHKRNQVVSMQGCIPPLLAQVVPGQAHAREASCRKKKLGTTSSMRARRFKIKGTHGTVLIDQPEEAQY